VVRSSSFSFVGFSTTLSMGGVSFTRLLTGLCVSNSHEGYAAFSHSADPQHSVISLERADPGVDGRSHSYFLPLPFTGVIVTFTCSTR
jgi:hypothetical protein